MTPITSAPTRALKRLRRTLGVVVAGIAALALAACGAVIDTTLQINADGSGVRTITATLAAEDLSEYVSGGVEAIEGAIDGALPEGMTYEGVGEGEEGASVFTFTIPFDDPDEYEEKVISILGAGGVVDLDAGADIVLADSVFRSGISVSENFTSQHLLDWLVDALVDNGTVDSSSRSDVSEIGTTAVKTGDVAFDTGAQIEYSDIEDFGVRALTITTSGVAGDVFERTIEYDLSREAYAHDADGYDAFFAEATPEGGTLTEPAATETIWTIALPAAPADEIVAYTNTALDSDDTVFGVTSEVSTTTAGEIITSVVDRVDCSAICAEGVVATSLVETPSGWRSSASTVTEDETSRTYAMPISSDDPVDFVHRIPFTSVDVVGEVVPDETSTIEFSFALPTADAEVVGDGIAESLTPTSTYGSIDVSEDADETVYTVTLTGSSPSALSSAIGEYLSNGSAVGAHEAESGLFSASYGVRLQLELPGEWTSGGVAEGITYTLRVPGGYGFDEGASFPSGTSVDGGEAVYTTTSTEPVAFSGIVTKTKLGVLLGVIAGAVVLVAAILTLVWWLLRRRRSTGAPGAAVAPQPVGPAAPAGAIESGAFFPDAAYDAAAGAPGIAPSASEPDPAPQPSAWNDADIVDVEVIENDGPQTAAAAPADAAPLPPSDLDAVTPEAWASTPEPIGETVTAPDGAEPPAETDVRETDVREDDGAGPDAR